MVSCCWPYRPTTTPYSIATYWGRPPHSDSQVKTHTGPTLGPDQTNEQGKKEKEMEWKVKKRRSTLEKRALSWGGEGVNVNVSSSDFSKFNERPERQIRDSEERDERVGEEEKERRRREGKENKCLIWCKSKERRPNLSRS